MSEDPLLMDYPFANSRLYYSASFDKTDADKWRHKTHHQVLQALCMYRLLDMMDRLGAVGGWSCR